jgi:hypothetical protein
MPNTFANAVGAVKDSAVQALVRALINREFEVIGCVTDLQLDSNQRTISAQVALRGETGPISIRIGAYELIQANGVTFISFSGFTASREWVGALLNKYVSGHKLQVPKAVRIAL